MIRKGSLVVLSGQITSPFLLNFMGQKFKVKAVRTRRSRKFAKLENGMLLPVAILKGLPQKKGASAPLVS